MNGICVGVDKARFVWSVVVCLRGANGEVPGVAGYCASNRNIAGSLIVGADGAESDGLILFGKRYLEVAVRG